MKRTTQDAERPNTLALIGSAVTGATIDHWNGELHLTLRHSATDWSGKIELPAPWTFTSCLLSLSSDQFDNTGEGLRPASDLIGLEGATLSAIERDENRLDLTFGSICLSSFHFPLHDS